MCAQGQVCAARAGPRDTPRKAFCTTLATHRIIWGQVMQGRVRTAAENLELKGKIRALVAQDMSWHQIAEAVGLGHRYIRSFANKNRILLTAAGASKARASRSNMGGRKRKYESLVPRIIKLLAQDKSWGQISDDTGLSETQLRLIAKRHGLKMTEEGKRLSLLRKNQKASEAHQKRLAALPINDKLPEITNRERFEMKQRLDQLIAERQALTLQRKPKAEREYIERRYHRLPDANCWGTVSNC